MAIRTSRAANNSILYRGRPDHCGRLNIEVHIVKSDDKIGGVGEPGVPSVALAIGNTVFDAIGARIRRLPMTTTNVLEALKSA